MNNAVYALVVMISGLSVVSCRHGEAPAFESVEYFEGGDISPSKRYAFLLSTGRTNLSYVSDPHKADIYTIDGLVANEISRDLEERGVYKWRPESDIRPGSPWRTIVINTSTGRVVLFQVDQEPSKEEDLVGYFREMALLKGHVVH
jgi:hypothetical protein